MKTKTNGGMNHGEAVVAMISANRRLRAAGFAIVETDGGYVLVPAAMAKALKVAHEIAW